MTDLNLPVIDKSKCTLCATCVDVCPEDVLAITAQTLTFVNPEQCTMCTVCEAACPENAVSCYFQIGWADNEVQNE